MICKTNIQLLRLFCLIRSKNKVIFNVGLILLISLNSLSAFSQSPSDALLMPSKNICILVSYESGNFNQYWEGNYLRKNASIGTLSRKTITTMAAIGIIKDLNAYISLPYIKTASSEPNGGHFAGAKGLQDIAIAFKYRTTEKTLDSGDLSLFTTLSFATPSSDYLSDYMPYSIGLGTSEFGIREIAKFQFKNGFYAQAMVGYFWRGYTEAERDYYYNNGSFYSNIMDVPNAWNFEGGLGVWLIDNRLKIEASYIGIRSTSGDNIRAYNAPQPTNRVNIDRIALSAQYYFKGIKGLGVLAYHNNVVNGLNTGKFSNSGLGLNYQFNYAKNINAEPNEK
ncbi:hypothetical protein SAMN05660703_0592 [Cellulophaga tyrosinoxydans]|uniref:MetA-pathway of phenol degradation n=2 Tax=Cellulophaga tyrosinoxydans TaxID=504486 RepID=A0A1W1YKL8_9FLAO|nr:hypothetical protein SAMN05660703_0592 [Cellulophaga tyrosinoxydans]